MYVLTDSIPIEKNKKTQYQSIWIRDLEDGAMIFFIYDTYRNGYVNEYDNVTITF